MATQTDTATTTETTLTLEAPQPLQNVQPAQAAGLVPLKEEQRSQLEEKVDTFVNELVALDSNSPEFGKKVDQLTSMGRREIAESAGASNRFLDRPVKAIDSNSPEFGKKVDALTAMGRKEIAEAAGASNRFLDRPVKAIDADTGIGADLTELRKTVESLDPAKNGRLQPGRKLFGLIPFGGRIKSYFRQYQSSQTHISAILAR
jgi:uncharacterized protein YaaN involved in tellurite resistance